MEIHGGVRFSIGAFNTEAQVDAAIDAMKEIARWKDTRKIPAGAKA
jgi:cysteine sulfinate desulfinase/cysteine desulfurase-like protein